MPGETPSSSLPDGDGSAEAADPGRSSPSDVTPEDASALQGGGGGGGLDGGAIDDDDDAGSAHDDDDAEIAHDDDAGSDKAKGLDE